MCKRMFESSEKIESRISANYFFVSNISLKCVMRPVEWGKLAQVLICQIEIAGFFFWKCNS